VCCDVNGHESSNTVRVKHVSKASGNAEYTSRMRDGTSECSVAVIKTERPRELIFICVNHVVELVIRNGPRFEYERAPVQDIFYTPSSLDTTSDTLDLSLGSMSASSLGPASEAHREQVQANAHPRTSSVRLRRRQSCTLSSSR